MDTNKILSADLLDLIFDDRNKAYGAYDLRKTYHTRIRKALIITASVTGLIIAGAAMASSMKPNDEPLQIRELSVIEIKEDEPEPPLPEPEQTPPPQPVHTEPFTNMAIVDDTQVDELPPTQDDLETAKIDVFKQEGVDEKGISEPTNPDIGTGVIEAKPITEPIIWEKVEIDAKFSGNWESFLRKNLEPTTPIDNGAPAGRYKVMVRFVVDVDGTVSDITPLTTMGYGMEQEAVRVLKKAAKWEPAFQNGKHVKAYRTQVIVFEVVGDE